MRSELLWREPCTMHPFSTIRVPARPVNSTASSTGTRSMSSSHTRPSHLSSRSLVLQQPEVVAARNHHEWGLVGRYILQTREHQNRARIGVRVVG